MFVLLFVASLLLSFGVAFLVAWGSRDPIENVLHHFFPANISSALAKYLQLATILIGVTSGARIRALQEYISAPDYNKSAMTAQLTQEFWVMEFYRTVIGTLEGILWLIFLFALAVFAVVYITRKSRPTEQGNGQARAATGSESGEQKQAKLTR